MRERFSDGRLRDATGGELEGISTRGEIFTGREKRSG
jgi:hypothetical protein